MPVAPVEEAIVQQGTRKGESIMDVKMERKQIILILEEMEI